MFPSPIHHSRALENAADAAARLDSLVGTLPRAFALALRAAAVSDLASAGVKGTRAIIVAAAASNDDLSPGLRRWRDFIEDEERRVRGGSPLTIHRLRQAGLPSDDARDSPLQRSLTSATAHGDRPPALLRAIEVAAHIGDRSWAEAVAALVLCAEGRMDRVWMLPFSRAEEDARRTAIAAWHAGDAREWEALALDSFAASARSRRNRLERALADLPSEDERLDALGRAAITARRALALLRESLVYTVPMLAGELVLSRPAAGDALERLVAAGIAVELTGRQRGRVFAHASALVGTA